MKTIKLFRSSIFFTGIEGSILPLSPFLIMLSLVGQTQGAFNFWRLFISLFAWASCFICTFIISSKPKVGKLFGYISTIGSYGAAFPYFSESPYLTLLSSVLFISIIFIIHDFRPKNIPKTNDSNQNLNFLRAKSAAITSFISALIILIVGISELKFIEYILPVSSLISIILFTIWAISRKIRFPFLIALVGISSFTLIHYLNLIQFIPLLVMVLSLIIFILLPGAKWKIKKDKQAWEILLNYPARILVVSFLILCLIGTILLIIPASTESGSINIMDAIFTSVSSVCVTGLTVLDITVDFTLLGQAFILILIQLGGLGIMGITTVVLHAIGHRFSIKQEKVLTSIINDNHRDLLKSLGTILKFTFIAEATGTIILTVIFYSLGDSLMDASWRGIFTSISAFCNAGFSLQSNSLISYQENPMVLHTVSALIIFGGMAPATSLIIPKWISGKHIPIPARIALITTLVLLFSGAFLFLALEWNGVLTGLSVSDKIQNAWFQSVTLRTAGFNSIDMSKISDPTLIIFLIHMFIGGSPGGTAGGVKTTTIGILAMTFWANITNRDEIITLHRRIPPKTVYRAITIVASGMIIWFIIVLMLQVTQKISARDIIFEATSAIGTVGLSTGATLLLDEIGKIIIIIAMFAGRIGPMTLFMFLNDDQSNSISQCPDTNISLT